MIICPQCRTTNPYSSRFCGACGRPLSQPTAAPIARRTIPTWVILPAVGLLLLCMIGLLILVGIARQRETSSPEPADTRHVQNWQQIGPQEAAEIGTYIVSKERPDMAGIPPQVIEQDIQGHKVYDVTFVQQPMQEEGDFKQVVIVSIDTTQGKIFIAESN